MGVVDRTLRTASAARHTKQAGSVQHGAGGARPTGPEEFRRCRLIKAVSGDDGARHALRRPYGKMGSPGEGERP